VVTLDHLILTVNDRDASVRFYTEVMAFGYEGEDGPFSVIRVSPDTTLHLAPWGNRGRPAPGLRPRTRRVRRRLRPGARGPGPTVYLFDPNGHLMELRHY
jgi:catechol 2,3-dioxygenase-like lactoylglutathione lyase family enzyme